MNGENLSLLIMHSSIAILASSETEIKLLIKEQGAEGCDATGDATEVQ
jgi:hypothetical protein